MINAATIQQWIIPDVFALHQLRLYLNLLMSLRIDLRLKRLIPRQCDLDRVLSGSYQHSSPAALELSYMSYEQPIEKNCRT